MPGAPIQPMPQVGGPSAGPICWKLLWLHQTELHVGVTASGVTDSRVTTQVRAAWEKQEDSVEYGGVKSQRATGVRTGTRDESSTGQGSNATLHTAP